jgi:hypothetical protein|tara:strand:- start:504 stop:719 length:216 start_codon:yes stop_codon:yes gene_type:complete
MKAREQVIFDIESEKFKYLQREENKIKDIVDIYVLNRRLNEVKKSNTYANIKIIAFSLLIIFCFALLSLKF